MTATFLGITGTLQAQPGVVHLVAEQLWTPPSPARARQHPQPRFSLMVKIRI